MRLAMDPTSVFEQMQRQINELLAQSPAKDLEKNVRALLRQGFDKLELATREDLDLQSELLRRARAQIKELETRVARLEESR
jgi:BMFP domain-containing protein YqiC